MVYLAPKPRPVVAPGRSPGEPADLYEAVATAMLGFSEAADVAAASAQSSADFALAASDRSSASDPLTSDLAARAAAAALDARAAVVEMRAQERAFCERFGDLQIAQGRIERSAAQWLARRQRAAHGTQCSPPSSEPRQAPPGPERSRNG